MVLPVGLDEWFGVPWPVDDAGSLLLCESTLANQVTVPLLALRALLDSACGLRVDNMLKRILRDRQAEVGGLLSAGKIRPMRSELF